MFTGFRFTFKRISILNIAFAFKPTFSVPVKVSLSMFDITGTNDVKHTRHKHIGRQNNAYMKPNNIILCLVSMELEFFFSFFGKKTISKSKISSFLSNLNFKGNLWGTFFFTLKIINSMMKLILVFFSFVEDVINFLKYFVPVWALN